MPNRHYTALPLPGHNMYGVRDGPAFEDMLKQAHAYVQEMGWDAFERQYSDHAAAGALWELIDVIRKQARDAAGAQEREATAARKAGRSRPRPVLPPRQAKKRGVAASYLHARLKDGRARPQRELEADALANGISAKTLKRAKAALGVESQRRGFGPGSRIYWYLPPNAARERQRS
jgi:hypothetical protein